MTAMQRKLYHVLFFLLGISMVIIFMTSSYHDIPVKRKMVINQTEILRLNGMVRELKSKFLIFKQNVDKSRILERQLERQARLRSFCLKQKNINTKRIDQNLLYDDNNTFIYCSIPKAACTNWKRIMLVLNGRFKHIMEEKNKDKVHLYNIKQLRKLKDDALTRRKNIYYQFLFVRHPFERLFASYRNKLLDPYGRGFQMRVGTKILRKYRTNLTENEYKQGRNVTFNEFVDWVIFMNKKYGLGGLDEHWQLMHRIANPCTFRYNYIGKFETLYDDADHVLKELNLTQRIQFPKRQADKYKTKSKRLMVDYFSKIPKNTLRDLYEIYKDDFEAFGYHKPDYIT